MQDAVGPVLRMCEEVERVIQSIVEDNPDKGIEIVESGAYVRIQAPGRMRVTLASLRRNVSPSFEMRQLEAMMPAFAGRIATTSEEVTWSLSSEGGVPGTREGT
jgi:toluene monooxygenase system protein D